MNRKYTVLENLTRVNRYSGLPLIKNESVADHVICMNAIALEYVPILNKKFNAEIDIKEVIYGIAIHDLDEALYTDIPRPFKHHDEAIEKEINRVVKTIFIDNISKDLYDDIGRAEDKHTCPGMLIKIIDVAQCGYKMLSEIELGNKFYIAELDNVRSTLIYYEDLIDEYFGLSHNSNQHDALLWIINQFLEDFKI